MRKLRLASTVLVLLGGLGAAAQAFPAPPPPATPADAVVRVHGCHRSCEWGPGRGWHRHGALCTPIACAPRAVYPGRCWVDRFGVRRCRW
ncbi:hypothetical protein PQJ75_19865 [Rhodoplanes sp. TEM]|uniref:Secreted protein n=1 Tax=Rhodoplanes tepidamans TaxID=200616 RepID=A0ABT5JAZ3_RHOTP|nr:MULTISPECIES: hypothetical protein [Rhodoplanes]MDC7786809.1 hypothetical protein [Rhodoplanes tepidamans]MDC7985991.1 hypothetical protein [Rhodoplanes sp. TEM]MDQ0355936.1 hypothetical protein [Rhodoplanes tepidamans]